ncbi:hypothetical protein V8E53_000152 [Lactarius tabidus]
MHTVLNNFFQTHVGDGEEKRCIQERILAERTKNETLHRVVCDQLVKPPSSVTDYLTRFSGITAAALARTLADIQTHLRTLILPSTILVGRSLESESNAVKFHLRCIDTALIFHHPCGRPLKPGLARLTRKWLGRIIQDCGPSRHHPKKDLQKFQADFELKSAFALAQSWVERLTHGRRSSTMETPGAWNGTSATAPATIACTNGAEVLDGMIGALVSLELIFRRLMMGLAVAFERSQPSQHSEGRKPNLVGEAQTKTESSEHRPDNNSNALFTAVTNLNDHLTTFHAALPPRTMLLLFSEHGDPRSTSTLAKRRAEYQAGQQGN